MTKITILLATLPAATSVDALNPAALIAAQGVPVPVPANIAALAAADAAGRHPEKPWCLGANAHVMDKLAARNAQMEPRAWAHIKFELQEGNSPSSRAFI
ncbi:UNVERIFIED_CONTAM: hypothetical protein HDU68_004964 [Siphonaria sp. JEL0065]|nr:hypothetical protein HDU68_004964 [Siphonaria sp. JEL0065]